MLSPTRTLWKLCFHGFWRRLAWGQRQQKLEKLKVLWLITLIDSLVTRYPQEGFWSRLDRADKPTSFPDDTNLVSRLSLPNLVVGRKTLVAAGHMSQQIIFVDVNWGIAGFPTTKGGRGARACERGWNNRPWKRGCWRTSHNDERPGN